MCFRTFHPGYAPDPVTDNEEAEWLVLAIEQTLAVAPLLKIDAFGDYRSGPGGAIERLTRVQGADGAWETTWTPVDTRLFSFPEPVPSCPVNILHACGGDRNPAQPSMRTLQPGIHSRGNLGSP